MLPVFGIDDIRNFRPRPCYDPSRYLPEGWQGTALDVLDVKDCPAADRLWVVLREECVSSRTLRLFAVWCARQALALVDNPDQRSVAACDTAERFANGEASKRALAAAWVAARAAASVAARDAASAAARDAARDAAWDAASVAASAAARDAASAAAWVAARDAARDAQIDILREKLTA
jgi:hypothetical protein